MLPSVLVVPGHTAVSRPAQDVGQEFDSVRRGCECLLLAGLWLTRARCGAPTWLRPKSLVVNYCQI